MPTSLIRVHSVEEEYVHLLVTPCRGCGLGPLAPASIELAAIEGRPADRVTAVCQKCGQKVVFEYDLSEFFGPQRSTPPGTFNAAPTPSSAVDLYGWVSMAGMLSSACQGEKDAGEARQLALEAQQCIAEALKFFADDADQPPESAFWTPEGQEDVASNPSNYNKQALLQMRLSLPGSGSAVFKPPPAGTEAPVTTATQAGQAKKGLLGLFRK